MKPILMAGGQDGQFYNKEERCSLSLKVPIGSDSMSLYLRGSKLVR
jgi:hypothetical protein